MNDYDDEVHRNALSAGLYVLSALIGFGIFYLVCCFFFDWAKS
jgi:hypothetical protein